MRRPLMCGHCAFPATHTTEGEPLDESVSHGRCVGGNTANPDGEFQPCPCPCNLGDEEYECGNCGRPLREALYWPNEDEPGEPVYVHIDSVTGRAIGEEC